MKKHARLTGLTMTLLLVIGCGGGGGSGLQNPEPNPEPGAPAPAPGPTGGGPDTTPPSLLVTSPGSGASGVSGSSVVRLTFSEPIAPGSASPASFNVAGVGGSLAVSGSLVTLTPAVSLAFSTTYTAIVRGGAGGITDAAGNALAADVQFSFTTAAPLICGGAVRCVGAGKAYATIQAAVDAAQAGDTVVVFDGRYRGFAVTSGGTSASRLTIKAEGNAVVIDTVNGFDEGITLSDVDHVTVEGFTVVGMPAFGIATHDANAQNPMRGIEIRNNTVTGSGSSNIYLSQVADSLIAGNTASGSRASHGFYLANGGSDNTVMRGNTSFNNFVNGFHFNGDSSVGGDGLQTGLTIESNVAYANSANGMNMDGVQGSTFWNNLVFNNARNGLRFYRIDGGAGPAGLRIINNTVDVALGTGWAVKLTEDGGGHVIFNNILTSAASAGGGLAVANSAFTSNYNRMTGKLSLDGDASSIGMAAWQAAGHDGASLTATAAELFINAAGGDYLLKAGSSAVNQGVSALGGVASPPSDIRGGARPQGAAPELGAYEQF